MQETKPLIEHLSTPRLYLKPLQPEDHFFIQELVNTPGWLRFIGDRKVHTPEDALLYIQKIRYMPNVHYWVVRRKEDDVPLGVITLIKREYLPHFDIGFAFLPQQAGKGYAFEAAGALLSQLKQEKEFNPILATTLPENESSIRLLKKMGFRFEREIDADETRLHVYTTAAPEVV